MPSSVTIQGVELTRYVQSTFKIKGGDKTIFHAGDTDLVDELGVLGPVDLALVPIGGTYTMDEADAANGSKQLIKPKIAIATHYGYATGGDPHKFKKLVGNAATVHILDPVFDVRA